jgi:hypothetical protein
VKNYFRMVCYVSEVRNTVQSECKALNLPLHEHAVLKCILPEYVQVMGSGSLSAM